MALPGSGGRADRAGRPTAAPGPSQGTMAIRGGLPMTWSNGGARATGP